MHITDNLGHVQSLPNSERGKRHNGITKSTHHSPESPFMEKSIFPDGLSIW
jgi:hypothetical protein